MSCLHEKLGCNGLETDGLPGCHQEGDTKAASARSPGVVPLASERVSLVLTHVLLSLSLLLPAFLSYNCIYLASGDSGLELHLTTFLLFFNFRVKNDNEKNRNTVRVSGILHVCVYRLD
jgi:hypothetical protein